MARPSPRLALLTTIVVSFLAFVFLLQRQPLQAAPRERWGAPEPHDVPETVAADTLKGDVIMPKLGNETLKAELGRAAWKVLHTTMARFPDQPSEDEKDALKSYIYLFARLYPCGECAAHFRPILKKFPPQVGSRSMAAAWACHVHNEVNKSLKKDLFDCGKIGDFYDCGCGDDDGDGKERLPPGEKEEMDARTKNRLTQNGRDINTDLFKPVQIAKEGPVNGG